LIGRHRILKEKLLRETNQCLRGRKTDVRRKGYKDLTWLLGAKSMAPVPL